jgi:hypothetical protein
MDDMEHVQTTQSKDEARLAELGYKQELKRDWTLMHNFGVSFSIIVSSKKPRAALLRSETALQSRASTSPTEKLQGDVLM